MLLADFEEALLLRGAVIASISDDDFFELCQANELLHIERTPLRELVIRPLPGCLVSLQLGSALGQLAAWSRRHGGHPLSWAGYTLPDEAVLGPGVSWVSDAAYRTLTKAQRQQFPPLCPQFVLELRRRLTAWLRCKPASRSGSSMGLNWAFCLIPTPKPPISTAPASPSR